MSDSPNLALPYLAPAQAQKHVTVNEALRRLDALVQIGVIGIGLNTPPANPADGDRYVTGPAPTGAWAGQAIRLAAWQDGAWAFMTLRPGWIIMAGGTLPLVWTGSGWSAPTPALTTAQRDAVAAILPDGFTIWNSTAQRLETRAGGGWKGAIAGDGLAVSATGAVGIGIAPPAGTPGGQLHVGGDIVMAWAYRGLYGNIRWDAGAASFRFIDNGFGWGINENAGSLNVIATEASNMSGPGATVVPATRLTISPAGNVGIGKTPGGFRLDVDGTLRLKAYTVATLPTGAAGAIAYASNARKNGEAAGAGTGSLVFHDGIAWRAWDNVAGRIATVSA